MDTIVPLISSGVAGPLGVVHLPRLWLKASLEARGKLAAGYPGAGKGYDQMVIDGLGLNREKVLAYIKDNKPTYTQFENWVKKWVLLVKKRNRNGHIRQWWNKNLW